MARRGVRGGEERGGDRAEQDRGSPHVRPPAVEPRHRHNLSLKDPGFGSTGNQKTVVLFIYRYLYILLSLVLCLA